LIYLYYKIHGSLSWKDKTCIGQEKQGGSSNRTFKDVNITKSYILLQAGIGPCARHPYPATRYLQITIRNILCDFLPSRSIYSNL